MLLWLISSPETFFLRRDGFLLSETRQTSPFFCVERWLDSIIQPFTVTARGYLPLSGVTDLPVVFYSGYLLRSSILFRIELYFNRIDLYFKFEGNGNE